MKAAKELSVREVLSHMVPPHSRIVTIDTNQAAIRNPSRLAKPSCKAFVPVALRNGPRASLSRVFASLRAGHLQSKIQRVLLRQTASVNRVMATSKRASVSPRREPSRTAYPVPIRVVMVRQSFSASVCIVQRSH